MCVQLFTLRLRKNNQNPPFTPETYPPSRPSLPILRRARDLRQATPTLRFDLFTNVDAPSIAVHSSLIFVVPLQPLPSVAAPFGVAPETTANPIPPSRPHLSLTPSICTRKGSALKREKIKKESSSFCRGSLRQPQPPSRPLHRHRCSLRRCSLFITHRGETESIATSVRGRRSICCPPFVRRHRATRRLPSSLSSSHNPSSVSLLPSILKALSSLCSVLGLDMKDKIGEICPTMVTSTATKEISNNTIKILSSEVETEMRRL
ncbi:hypothetical protein PIB30_061703 [Stylosanthes scabra]|uniref:Uncharacterized protein n=1 Tax=Stylosanthes scabra TaxID=79078 RepID=A0ABU6RM31_9FABA|nr:hypothetical protein [Stylosanthes scabra]